MNTDDLPPPQGERHVLAAEEELRLEVAFCKNSTLQLTLQKGSCELHGVELAIAKPIVFTDGGLKLALFTYYGCVIDVLSDDPDNNLEISYTSDETNCNIAYVNTHAQLEALRDKAAAACASSAAAAANGGSDENNNQQSTQSSAPASTEGPRVLVCGPTESGKSSLAKLLIAYATKLGRTPLWVDLDPADNAISVPGTLCVCPMTRDSVSLHCFATTGIPVGTSSSSSTTNTNTAAANASSSISAAAPLVVWHGTSSPKPSPDLFKAQVTSLGEKIDKRFKLDDWERSSGIVVNTSGWIQEEGYQLLLHTVQALRISVVLIMGHDRLYSMIKKDLKQKTTPDNPSTVNPIKVIKIPRSGGVVQRDANFLRQSRARATKRYFYGDMVESTATAGGAASAGGGGTASSKGGGSTPAIPRVPQLTPFLLQIPLHQVTLYRFIHMSLSASLLPVAAAQTTDTVRLEVVDWSSNGASGGDKGTGGAGEDSTSDENQTSGAAAASGMVQEHSLVAVCHPQAVAAYERSGQARDLYQAGVAGFCAIERILTETDMLHLLCPCAGSLPSTTLLLGDVTWME